MPQNRFPKEVKLSCCDAMATSAREARRNVTGLLHPAIAARAVEAAKAVGLDIAGVDVVATDIEEPLEGQGGAHCRGECRSRLADASGAFAGEPRPVGEAIIDSLFPEGQTGRVPSWR